MLGVWLSPGRFSDPRYQMFHRLKTFVYNSVCMRLFGATAYNCSLVLKIIAYNRCGLVSSAGSQRPVWDGVGESQSAIRLYAKHVAV